MYGEKADIRPWLGEGIKGDFKAIITPSGQVVVSSKYLDFPQKRTQAQAIAS